MSERARKKTGKVPYMSLKKLHEGSVFIPIFLLGIQVISTPSRAGVVEGKVTSVRGNLVELSLGFEKGIRLGDSGRIYYKITIGEKERQIFIAKFKISYLSEKSSMAQIEEKTGEIKEGFLAEVTVKSGELEVKSEPSGAKVYLDGKEVGESPIVLSDVSSGRHLIRVMKEGYENWEKSEIVEPGRRVEVLAQLKASEGELEVRSDPPGGKVYLDGKYMGVTPLHLLHIRPGKYSVLIVKEGYVPYEEQLEVTRAD